MGARFFFLTAEHAETAERIREVCVFRCVFFVLHRDFVIPMLRLVASEVRENNVPNPPKEDLFQIIKRFLFLVFPGVLCASAVEF